MPAYNKPLTFSQDEPNEEYRSPEPFHNVMPSGPNDLFAGLNNNSSPQVANSEIHEDPSFFNQIEPNPNSNNNQNDVFKPVQGRNIFNNNSQINQLGFENTSDNTHDLLNTSDFNYSQEQQQQPIQTHTPPKEIPIHDSNNDWTNMLDSVPEKATIPLPLGVDPAKQIEIEERLANYEPKDEDPYISRIEILRLSEIINVEEEAALYKLMLTKKNLVVKALDAQNKTGSTVILDELLNRKKNIVLPDTIISIDDMGTEKVSLKTLASLSNRSYYPDMFFYDNCFCTIIQSRTATRFSFSNKWEDIFIMIGHNEIRIYDSVKQASQFEDPRETITLSPYMNTCDIYDKKYTGIRIYILKIVEVDEDERQKNNLFYFDNQYPTNEILKIGSTSQQTVVIVKTQIQSILSTLQQNSMKAAQSVENHIEGYHD